MERESRHATHLPALFRSLDSSSLRYAGEGIIRNLSANGCMIEARSLPPRESELVVYFYRDKHPIRIQIERASVRWSAEGRFGLKFLEAHPEEWLNLREVLRQVHTLVPDWESA